MAQTVGTSNKIDVWADDGTVVEPASSKVDVGWQLGEQPPHEFMNWLQNTFGQKLNHVLQHGVPRWNDATEYGVGDFVTHNDQLYRAINVNTNSEPPSGNWQSYQIQSSPTDTTAGRLLTPGAFGVGGQAVPASSSISIDDNTLPSGLAYRYSPGTTPGSPPPAASDGVWMQIRRDDGSGVGVRVHQLFFRQGFARVHVRFYDGSAWSDWAAIYSQENIVGTTTQSGGIPTGAAFESDSNDDGEYTRFADGTQICRIRGTVPEVTTSTGNVFRSSEVSVDPPRSFVGSDITTSVGVRSTNAYWGKSRLTGSGQIAVMIFGAVSGSSSIIYEITVVGRWF